MDPDAMVNAQTDSGQRLIEALAPAGFTVSLAFWAKPTDDGKWFLYLVSPVVDEQGPALAYRCIHEVMRQMPDLWLDPLEIRVIGRHDSLAQAALAVTRANVAHSPFSVRQPQPNPGMTRFSGAVLGGVSIDGAYIYPPVQSAA